MSTQQLDARIAWSVIADPDDALATHVVRALGFELSLDAITAPSNKAKNALRAAGIEPAIADAALGRWVPRLREVDVIRHLIERLGISAHSSHELAPPALLPHLPAVIYSIGDTRLLDAAVVAAAREEAPRDNSQEVVEAFVTPLTLHHSVAASDRPGDMEIHRVVSSAGGSAIAVFMGGVDRVARRNDARLFRQISESGLILSATPPGVDPDRSRVSAQNALLAAIANQVLILGAERSSPAADLGATALQLPKPVGAITNSALTPSAAGIADLLHSGAQLIATPEDAIAFMQT